MMTSSNNNKMDFVLVHWLICRLLALEESCLFLTQQHRHDDEIIKRNKKRILHEEEEQQQEQEQSLQSGETSPLMPVGGVVMTKTTTTISHRRFRRCRLVLTWMIVIGLEVMNYVLQLWLLKGQSRAIKDTLLLDETTTAITATDFNNNTNHHDNSNDQQQQQQHVDDEDPLSPLRTMFLLDALSVVLFLTFPFAAPLHSGLGWLQHHHHHHQHTKQQHHITVTTQQLASDVTTKRIVGVFGMASIFAMISGVGSFLGPYTTHIFMILYFPCLLVSVMITFGSMLLLTLSMRAFYLRLYQTECEVVAVLEQQQQQQQDEDEQEQWAKDSNNNNNNNNNITDTGTQEHHCCQTWLVQYRNVRHDLHHLTTTISGGGTRFGLAIFIYAIETTMIVAKVWEEFHHDMPFQEALLLMFGYCSNATSLVVTVNSIAYLVTECTEHIGPKLAILASHHSNQQYYSSNSSQNNDAMAMTKGLLSSESYRNLAVTFLNAPVRFHHGNFEVSPEYATALSFWFVGLFLLVFGLKLPGGAE